MSARNACAGPFGAFYDFWIERERLARLVGGTLWGIDVRPMHGQMQQVIGGAPDGSVLIDVPCGGGVAFRWLRPEQRVRYVAVDLDFGAGARTGHAAPSVIEADLRGWLGAAGFESVEYDARDGFAVFAAVRSA